MSAFGGKADITIALEYVRLTQSGHSGRLRALALANVRVISQAQTCTP
jgi:hypothetical protein